MWINNVIDVFVLFHLLQNKPVYQLTNSICLFSFLHCSTSCLLLAQVQLGLMLVIPATGSLRLYKT